MKFTRLRSKIIASVAVCILFVGVFSYSFLFTHLSRMVSEKAERTEQFTLETVQRRLEHDLQSLYTLAITQAGDISVARAMQYTTTGSTGAGSALLKAQQVMVTALTASSLSPYMKKFMVFNEHGITVQAVSAVTSKNTAWDSEAVRALPLFAEFEESGASYSFRYSPSIVDGQSGCLAFIGYVNSYSGGHPTARGWLYAELDTAYFEDILRPYTENGLFVAATAQPGQLVAGGSTLPGGLLDTLAAAQADETGALRLGSSTYRVLSQPLAYGGLSLYSASDVTIFEGENRQILVTVLVVAGTTVAIVVLLALLLANFVTRPLERLTARLRRISDNDFAFDPAIEKGSDELAQVGRAVNEMTMSIDSLLKTTETMYEKRKDAEIALLQSQVNPHFLYNTLDSIHWMALIQNNTGIAKTVRSLSNLLKNLAKGTGDKITLKEELALLADYTDTQKVRFMEMFEIRDEIPPELLGCRIVKFTLQPLVENAIFHGLEPLGRCGTITLTAREDGGDLLIFVEDDGVGMTPDELASLMESAQNPHPKGMAGIGIANVDSRLKLTYGPRYGLHYESEKGVYTRVTLRIPREEANDV